MLGYLLGSAKLNLALPKLKADFHIGCSRKEISFRALGQEIDGAKNWRNILYILKLLNNPSSSSDWIMETVEKWAGKFPRKCFPWQFSVGLLVCLLCSVRRLITWYS